MEPMVSKRSILIGVALVAATLVIGGAIAAVVILSGRDNQPEDLLPAGATAAVLRDLSAEHLAFLRTAMPSLGVPDAVDRGATAALIRLPSGATEWIWIVPVGDRISGIEYKVEGSPSALVAGGTPLSRDASFRRLAARRVQGEPWIFLQLPLLQGDVHPLLAAATEGASHVAALRTGGVWRFLRYPSSPETQPAPAERDLRLGFPSPALVLHLVNASGASRRLDGFLTPDGRAVAEGLLRQEMLERTGAASGWLLPLLSRDATLEIAQTGSGARFLLRGSVQDPRMLEELHDRFAAALPRVRVVTMALDDNTTWTDLRADPASIRQSREEVEGWTVRTTGHADSARVLVTATSGEEVLLGDDEAALLAVIRGTGPQLTLRAAGATGHVHAGGMLRLSALKGLLPPSLPSLLLGDLALPWDRIEPLAWKVEREGEVTALVLSRPGAAEPEPAPLTEPPGMPR